MWGCLTLKTRTKTGRARKQRHDGPEKHGQIGKTKHDERQARDSNRDSIFQIEHKMIDRLECVKFYFLNAEGMAETYYGKSSLEIVTQNTKKKTPIVHASPMVAAFRPLCNLRFSFLKGFKN